MSWTSCYVLCPGLSCSFWFLPFFSDPRKASKIETEIIFKLRKTQNWNLVWRYLRSPAKSNKIFKVCRNIAVAKCALDFFPVTSSSGDKIFLKNMATLCRKMAAFWEIKILQSLKFQTFFIIFSRVRVKYTQKDHRKHWKLKKIPNYGRFPKRR